MKNFKSMIIITYCLLALCGFSADYFYGQLPEISLCKAQSGIAVDTVSYSGTIQAPIYCIYSTAQSVVADIYVREGQYVEEGQLLARLDINDKSSVSISNGEIVSIPFSLGIDEMTIMDAINSSILQENNVIIMQSGAAIRASHAGVVRGIHAKTGEYVTSLQPMFEIMDYEDMVLRVWVGEDRISNIEVGQYVTISGSGFSGKYTGNVTAINRNATQPILSDGGSQVAVMIAIDDADDSILPGFTATATIRLGVRKNIVKLPISLIEQDQRGQEYVWIYRDGMVYKEFVQCKYSSADYVEMINFDMNQYVVFETSLDLREGGRVALCEAWKTW